MLPYNDLDAVRAAFAEHGDRIAAVIVEAAAANMGVVPPDARLQRARSSSSRTRTARSSSSTRCSPASASRPAGWWGLERGTDGEYTPDLLTFGKVIGGGMPVAALGGRADVMEQLAPLGPVYQAGTLSGNPVAVAAGVATLAAADAAVYAQLDAAAATISAAVSDALAAEGVAHAVQRAGNLFSFVFGDDVASGVRDYAGVQRAGGVAVPAVLPRDARRGRLAAAVGVRGVVRHRRARRRGHRPDRRRAARRGARRGIRSPGLTAAPLARPDRSARRL